jgi:hypothetical protein
MLFPLFASCVLMPNTKKEEFQAAPSLIDERIETASIEDYVIALPPFAYHEESVESFAASLRRARASQKENEGKGLDYLFLNGDGCWPPKDFVLDRHSRTLRIRIYNWELGTTDYPETMRRVPGGWMRGPQAKIKTVVQGEAQQPPLAALSATSPVT